jgi:hypothetical protein
MVVSEGRIYVASQDNGTWLRLCGDGDIERVQKERLTVVFTERFRLSQNLCSFFFSYLVKFG